MPARAADDTAVLQGMKQVMNGDYADANYGAARTKLKGLLERCRKAGCSASTTSQLNVSLGMVHAQTNQPDEAKKAFSEALLADPAASLPANATASMKAAFDEARKAIPKQSIAGWQNREAYELAAEAAVAATAGDLAACLEKDRASLLLEEQPGTRLHLSFCEYRSGKLLDALRDARKALDVALAKRDADAMNAARKRVEDLITRIPHVTFEVPTSDVEDLGVFFDQRKVPNDSLKKQYSVDPGKHAARAEGKVNGVEMAFDQEYDVQEGELVTVRVTLRPADPKFLTPGQIACMRAAKDQSEVARCLPAKEKPLVIKAGIDVGGYIDTTAVRVFSPTVHAAISSPSGGWNVGASYLVDVVSAASPDVVSTASRKFHDTRHAVGVNGGYKPGRFGADAGASLSVENDYVSRAGRVGVLGDFADKRVTPRIGYGHVQDTIGRAGTPYDVFSNSLSINEFEASATVVLSPMSVLVVGGSTQFERGDQSKPYRLIPMFDAGVTAPIGASVAQVNRDRLPVRPYEQLPLERDRYALAGRFITRLGTSTLRLEQRLYRDSWAILGSTSDARWIKDLTRRLSAWPHVHVHAQTAANFYNRVYHAELAPEVRLPIFRTTDREVSPLVSVTGGGGARLELAPPAAQIQYGIVISTDVMYTHYFNALFVTNRLAVYGMFGFEAQFE
jgi:hypothetical protein